MDWKNFDLKDKTTWPIEKGLYAVMVSGDSDYEDGHCVYAYDDYQTFATVLELDPEDGEEGIISFVGQHDETEDTIFAYYGPIIIPKYAP
jgi:hypothetical protein